jgi:uncharacterized protein
MTLRPSFWTLPLSDLNPSEWEALCDGCGKCCLNKLEDEETGEIAYTRVACRLFDGTSCRCSDYAGRLGTVPECVVLTPDSLVGAVRWLPRSCAYKRRFRGEALPQWHYLISGDRGAVHRLKGAIRGRSLNETEVPEDAWENHLIRVET